MEKGLSEGGSQNQGSSVGKSRSVISIGNLGSVGNIREVDLAWGEADRLVESSSLEGSSSRLILAETGIYNMTVPWLRI